MDIELSTGINKFSTLESVLGYRADPTPFTAMRDLTPV
jgi:hypothetical protein